MSSSHAGKRPASRSPESGMPARKVSRPSVLDQHRPSPRDGVRNTVQSPSSVNSRGSAYQDAGSNRATSQPQTPARTTGQAGMDVVIEPDPVTGVMSLLHSLCSNAAQMEKLESAREAMISSRDEADRQRRKLAKQNPALAADFEKTRKAQSDKVGQIDDQIKKLEERQKETMITARSDLRALAEINPKEDTSVRTDAISRDFVPREEHDKLKDELSEQRALLLQVQESVVAVQKATRLDDRVEKLEIESKTYQNGMQQLHELKDSHDELRQQKTAHESDLQAQDSRLTTSDGRIKSLELRLPKIEDKVDDVVRTLDSEVLEQGKPSVVKRLKKYDIMLNNIDPYVKRLQNEKGCALKRMESLEQSRMAIKSTVDDLKQQVEKRDTPTPVDPKVDERTGTLETRMQEAASKALTDGQAIQLELEEHGTSIKHLLDRPASAPVSTSATSQQSSTRPADAELSARFTDLETRVSSHDQRFSDIEQEADERDDMMGKSINAELGALATKLEGIRQELLDKSMETSGNASVLEVRVKALETEQRTTVVSAQSTTKATSGLHQFRPMASASPGPMVNGLDSPLVNGSAHGQSGTAHLTQQLLDQLAAYHAMVTSVKQRMDNMTSDHVVDKMVARMIQLHPAPSAEMEATLRQLVDEGKSIAARVTGLGPRIEAANTIADAAKRAAEVTTKDMAGVLVRVDKTDKSVAEVSKKIEGCVTYTVKANDLTEAVAKQASKDSKRVQEDFVSLVAKVDTIQEAAVEAQALNDVLTKEVHKITESLLRVETKVGELTKRR
ncbi:hypothetical protein B0A48_14159 [Cryoendolithus antarcticus]|uniref:Uncharacterized protein n=1 Tax=Cryoendolithus antarcticus TaxID=1507870 RepID=A0A1V8SLB6_9PEZI|nr:hypothetical protein B0A48_14159 [Cryoendolithus antarcticus]